MLSENEINLGLESNDHTPWDLLHHTSVRNSPHSPHHYKDIFVLLTMTALPKGFVNGGRRVL